MKVSLDKLTIRGFKSIRSLENFRLKDINILIGANGAGKSNLIEFFRLIKNVIDGNLNDYIRLGGGISDFLFDGRKRTSQMDFETYFGSRGYRFTVKPGAAENCLLTDEARFYEGSKSTPDGWWRLVGTRMGNQSLLANEVTEKNKDSEYSRSVYDGISSWQIYHFHDTSSTAGMRHYQIVQDDEKLRFDGSNVAPYLLRLKNRHPDEYREILDTLGLVMPFFDDFILEPSSFGEREKVNLSWRQRGSDYPMQPYHLSDGSIRFICLATALLQPNPPSTIVVDEPELGLHPFAVALLAELIQNASCRTQLIVATQSPIFIDHFKVDDIVVVNRKDGSSTFDRLEEEEYREWLEDYSTGELWRKNLLSGGPSHE
ncbi:MAG: recombinase RecF [Synergistales bacterium]|nr:recombinase RecF [Synergistales bacterium]